MAAGEREDLLGDGEKKNGSCENKSGPASVLVTWRVSFGY